MYKITWTYPKVVYSVGGAVASFTYSIQSAMGGLLVCLVADTITGIIAAPYRGQRRNSTSLRRAFPKLISYLSAGLLAHVCEALIFPQWVASNAPIELGRIVFTVCAVNEVMSCFENLKDITGLRIFDILTMNFKKKVEETTGIKMSNKRGIR